MKPPVSVEASSSEGCRAHGLAGASPHAPLPAHHPAAPRARSRKTSSKCATPPRLLSYTAAHNSRLNVCSSGRNGSETAASRPRSASKHAAARCGVGERSCRTSPASASLSAGAVIGAAAVTATTPSAAAGAILKKMRPPQWAVRRRHLARLRRVGCWQSRKATRGHQPFRYEVIISASSVCMMVVLLTRCSLWAAPPLDLRRCWLEIPTPP